MTYPNDLYNSPFGFGHNDQIIDSYELIKNLTIEFEGQALFEITIEKTLPLIKGNPELLYSLFREFIFKAISTLNHYTGRVKIVHLKDLKSWIFSFSFESSTIRHFELPVFNLGYLFLEFNLVISKNGIPKFYEIPSMVAHPKIV